MQQEYIVMGSFRKIWAFICLLTALAVWSISSEMIRDEPGFLRVVGATFAFNAALALWADVRSENWYWKYADRITGLASFLIGLGIAFNYCTIGTEWVQVFVSLFLVYASGRVLKVQPTAEQHQRK